MYVCKISIFSLFVAISVHLTFCHICLVIIKCSRNFLCLKLYQHLHMYLITCLIMFAFILKSVFKSYSQFQIHYLPKFCVIQASCVISCLLWQNFVLMVSGEAQWYTIQDLLQIDLKKILLTRYHMIHVSIHTHEYYR